MKGLKPEVIPSHFDEKSLDKSSFASPLDFVQENALQKALEVAERLGESDSADLIIGADTVVVLDDVILEKPESEAAAVDMLSALSGRGHIVATGVAFVWTDKTGKKKKKENKAEEQEQEEQEENGDGRMIHTVHYGTIVETAQVEMAEIPSEEILAYVAHGDYADKAGGYGIQSLAALYVSGIRGDYYCVKGFPIHRVAAILANHWQP